MSVENSTADRELRLTRLLNASVELVWEVFTDPEHIKHWWGPNGFTNTITKMEIEPGGEWDLVMHGPDGTDYKNKIVFKEIVKHKKIVYDHVSGPKFLTTIEFEELGKQTQINWHMLFESKEQFIQVVKTFKADEGLKQNIDKLELYLQQQVQLLNKQL
ncbi:SRPBCC family protein [Lacibacter sp. H407]|uniref:SRPBCC family protein n=1 Tax=Lacibacter sp. H407 TaxID=3133423 RepID=UPI0030C34C01